jgi:Tol biopolymer transport system component
MKNSYRTSIIASALVASVLMASAAVAQLPRDPVERARVIAEIFKANARQITVFDREGKVVSSIGPRDLYNQPVLSPDAKRLAVVKPDLEKETNDVWVLDVATGKGIQLTSSQSRESANSPVWSPDGGQLAFVALRAGYYGLYRKASNGEGPEELLYRVSAPITLTDWSMDGRFLSYFSTDLAGGALYALPLNSAGERKPIEMLRSKSQLQGPRLSPDSRFVSYVTNESGRNEVYVRPFDPGASAQGTPAAAPWQISDQGGQGMAYWRRDGKELYYLAANRAIMAVTVTSSPKVEFGKPKVLFRPSEATPINAGMASMSRDGERVVIVIPPPQLRQMTVFDRQGKILSTAGQPGLYVQPGFSPDGTRVVVMRNDPQTGNQDIWTFDLATGKGTPITNDTSPENAPIWSPDGKQVAYVSTRESYSGIYRKAADGTGSEELLFRYTPGAGMVLTDWSPDGKFLVFNDFSGVLLIVPLRADEKALDRKGIEWLREDYEVAQGRFSSDGRFLAYLSNEADGERMEVYVRPFDASKPETSAGPAVQVSRNGALGMIFWRQDGKEMYFMTREWEVMAVDLTTTPTLQAGTPRVLFKLQGPLAGNPSQWKNVSRDGERFIFAMPATPASAAR